MKGLIIGRGEVGRALHVVLSEYYPTEIRDVEDLEPKGYEILHLAYPDGPNFVDAAKAYIHQYRPKLTVIHSSVRVGTTDKVAAANDFVVHSPVRGRHPNLEREMKAFPKFVGGRNQIAVNMAKSYFQHAEWVCDGYPDPRATELVKMLSNIYLGLEIAWRQEVERICKTFGVSSFTYEQFEATYNEGYRRLGQEQLIRPKLSPRPIGGHCILPCTDLLGTQYPSKAFDFIRGSNAQAVNENKNSYPETGTDEPRAA